MDISLFGAKAEDLRDLFDRYDSLRIVEDNAEVIVCYGGDGTLLAAELQWPGIPKVPIRNSRRGIRCIAEPPEVVVEQLANNNLVHTEHLKLECTVHHKNTEDADSHLMAINEFNMHMARTNAAVRFRIWFDDKPYGEDHEIIGDGFVVSTPFGSTAYFNQITRGVFWQGIGIAFKYTSTHTNHLIVPEDTVVRARITRGPAILAFDNSSEYVELLANDELTIAKSDQPAVLLTTDA